MKVAVAKTKFSSQRPEWLAKKQAGRALAGLVNMQTENHERGAPSLVRKKLLTQGG
jgi:hypothetical protein